MRVDELRLGEIAGGGHLVDLRLIGTRIDLCQQVALVHVLPFDEVDADDLSLDLAGDQHRVVGDNRADAGEVDRHVVLRDRSGNDRNCRAGTERAAGSQRIVAVPGRRDERRRV